MKNEVSRPWSPPHAGYGRRFSKTAVPNIPDGFERVEESEWDKVPENGWKYFDDCWEDLYTGGVTIHAWRAGSSPEWTEACSHIIHFARPIPKPKDGQICRMDAKSGEMVCEDSIKAPEGYELVPKEEWDSISDKTPGIMFFHADKWQAFDFPLSLDLKIRSELNRIKAFARPIKATDVIKVPVPPEGYKLAPKLDWSEWHPLDREFKYWDYEQSEWRELLNYCARPPMSLKELAERMTIHLDRMYFCRPIKKETPLVPEGYEIVTDDCWIVNLSDGWLFYHPTASWCPLSTNGVMINAFRAAYPSGQIGLIVRPVKKETPTPWDEPDPSNKLDTAQLKESPLDDRVKKIEEWLLNFCNDYWTSGKGKEDVAKLLKLVESEQAQAHVIKKLLRAGHSHKPLEQEIAECIKSLNRWLEMIKEDSK